VRPKIRALCFAVVSTIVLHAPIASAQDTAAYDRRELTIPVRDGIELFAVALVPKAAPGPLPILLIRTPFGASGIFRGAEVPPTYREQRFVDGRPDVLTFESAPLDQDLTIAGDVVAHLFASTTGSDADWVVKLIDVYPDSVPDRPWMGGYQLIVNADVMRGRYWKGFTRATPIPVRTVTPFQVDLHQQLYRFMRGHRLMVQIQSTWFPLYDRNPQTFVANIFRAKPSDFRAREHRVWHTGRYPSHIVLPVLP